jgi:hypothetical protein
VKFFFPDAHDYVDPEFDFEADTSPTDRERYVTDQYAHELLGFAPYDGMLISKSIVDGAAGKSGKYTVAQRHRLLREGVHRFFRVEHLQDAETGPFPIMGDCGAFSYVREKEPPISVTDAIEFYESTGVTHGQSVDHIIADFRPDWDEGGLFGSGPPKEVRDRFDVTLHLAREFIAACRKKRVKFIPVGVAQGWSPASYVAAVKELQDMGFTYIALGGLVPLKTNQLMQVVRSVMPTVRSNVRIHLLGVIRWEHLDEFVTLGVTSFDSTSPLRQAFLDGNSNYHVAESGDRAYAAVRIPQLDGNLRLKRRIQEGSIELDAARDLERRCLDGVRAWDRDSGAIDLQTLLDQLDKYVGMIDGKANWREKNARTLSDRPWKQCPCSICADSGVEVALFRGANRNRRRGFHNLFVAQRRIQQALIRSEASKAASSEAGVA